MMMFLCNILFYLGCFCSLFITVNGFDDARRCVDTCNRPYFGDLNTTVTGKPCRPWRQSDIRLLGRATPFFDPVEMGSKCRNPSSIEMPWCFVSDTRREFCFKGNCQENRLIDSELCNPGHRYFNNFCYKFIPQGFTDKRIAKQFCSGPDSRLANILSFEELDFVHDLSCLPKLLGGGLKANGDWEWRGGSSYGISRGKSQYPWCNGYPTNNPDQTCLTLHSLRCFRNVHCRGGTEVFYPICKQPALPPKFVTIDIQQNTPNLWLQTVRDCEDMNLQLCSYGDLCSGNIFKPFKFHQLPLIRDNWVPISDLYEDWVYVGPDTGRQCQRYATNNGPPDVNSGILRNKAICCKTNPSLPELRLPESVPTTVYVKFTDINRQHLYKFSLNKENTPKEIKYDQLSWNSFSSVFPDISSFQLMSNFVEFEFEVPVYFCIQDSTMFKLKTQLHKISLTPCQPPYRLNFYLYTSTKLQFSTADHLFVSTGPQGSSGVFRKSPCCNYKESFKLNARPLTTAHVVLSRPCSLLLRLREMNGVIRSFGFPVSLNVREGRSCRWRIIAPDNYNIRINITSLSLYSPENHVLRKPTSENERFRSTNGGTRFNHNQTCPNQRLTITTTSKTIDTSEYVNYGTFCGEFPPPSFTTISSKVVVIFSNYVSELTSKGFLLRYEMIKPPSNLTVVESTQLSWIDSRNTCRSSGKDLCFKKEICRYNNRPFHGVEAPGLFTPVLDEYNEWVNVGNGPTCDLHNSMLGPPLWGLENCTSSDQGCRKSNQLYCCDHQSNYNSKPPSLVTVRVFNTQVNGVVFQNYIREGIDIPPSSDTLVSYSPDKVIPQDVSTFQMSSTFTEGFNKVIYFCSKFTNPPIGNLIRVHKASELPCKNGWRLQFYLYAAENKVTETLPLFVIIQYQIPFHSRIYKEVPSTVISFNQEDSFKVYVHIPASDLLVPSGIIDRNRCSERGVGLVVQPRIPLIIQSPNYPYRYTGDLNCVWYVRLADTLPKDTKLQITIVASNIEETELCINDGLEIFEGIIDRQANNFTEEKSIQKICSRQGELSSFISQKSLKFHFFTDADLNKSGFQARIEVVTDMCGGNITDNGAVVTSPGFPLSYDGNLQCDWNIVAPNSGYSIEIAISTLDIRNTTDCTEDYLLISGNDDPPQRICRKLTSHRLQFESNPLQIQFITSADDSDLKGFSFSVFFIPKNTQPSCGVQGIPPWTEGPRDRIIGGLEAVVGSWPWVVALDGASCGGVLIDERWVMTAGHCFAGDNSFKDWTTYKPDLSRFSVLVGRHYLNVDSPDQQVMKIMELFMYPTYHRRRPPNVGIGFGSGTVPIHDIALLKLSQKVRFTGGLTPICLPSSDPPVGQECVIAGWGNTKGTGGKDERRGLRYARLPILETSICNSYPKLDNSIADTNICAGFERGRVDSCFGDSGGPLMCKNGDNSYVVSGIVSWGKDCGVAKQPGIYTRVWSYYQWITDTIYNN